MSRNSLDRNLSVELGLEAYPEQEMQSAPVTQDLTVKGESIERVYGTYTDRRYVVNRRYQRKLIWTSDEKIAFIDSILRGYPVPILLLAEDRRSGENAFEIIDGMQRLNAVMSFIENDYMVDGAYFDLNTMAVTKALLDRNLLAQRTPVMERDRCVKIASYLLPLSIYEFSDETSVDDVFRRINSGGRKLSRQELRAAGATGHFAQVVRRIAAKIRGDDSHSDVLRLNDMKRVSITNRELSYGIDVDEIFWVKQGIITKEQVRESRDEELIADVVAFMVSDQPTSSRAEFLDDYFGLGGDDDASLERGRQIETAIQKRTQSLVILDFQRAIDELRLTLAHSGQTLGQLLFAAQPARAPRYFQAVFLAFYELIVRKGMEVTDRGMLVDRMRNSGNSISVPEGGNWGADQRRRTIDAVVGMYGPAFGPASVADPAIVHWITQLENILSQSYTEQNSYDFKQGFLRLDGTHALDEGSFQKILETCVGIANIGKSSKGYVLIGVVGAATTAARIEGLYKTKPKAYETFFITGVEHEAKALEKTLDQLFQTVVEKIRNSAVSKDLRDYLSTNIKLVRYYDLSVFVIEVSAQADPSHIGGKYFIRQGAQLVEIPPTDLAAFIRKYIG